MSFSVKQEVFDADYIIFCKTVCSFLQLVDGHFTLSFGQQLSAAVKEIRQSLCPSPATEMIESEEDELRLEPSSFNAGTLCAMCGLLTFVDEVG